MTDNEVNGFGPFDWLAWRRRRAYLRACIYIEIKRFEVQFPARAPMLVPCWGKLSRKDEDAVSEWEPEPIPDIIEPVEVGGRLVSYEDHLGMWLRWRGRGLHNDVLQPGDPRYRSDRPGDKKPVWRWTSEYPVKFPLDRKKRPARPPTKQKLVNQFGFKQHYKNEQDREEAIRRFHEFWYRINAHYTMYKRLNEITKQVSLYNLHTLKHFENFCQTPMIPTPTVSLLPTS